MRVLIMCVRLFFRIVAGSARQTRLTTLPASAQVKTLLLCPPLRVPRSFSLLFSPFVLSPLPSLHSPLSSCPYFLYNRPVRPLLSTLL